MQKALIPQVLVVPYWNVNQLKDIGSRIWDSVLVVPYWNVNIKDITVNIFGQEGFSSTILECKFF